MSLTIRKHTKALRLLFVADVHWIVRDRAAWAVAEAFRALWRPDHLVCLGDLVDFTTVSRFLDVQEGDDGSLRTPAPDELAEELAAAGTVLARWRRELPAARIDFVAGNHEAHLARYLAGAARPVLGEANLPRRWNLGALGIRYTRYGDGRALPYGPEGLWITHGARAGVNAARGELALWNRPGISGHIHRADRAVRRTGPATWQTWVTAPCLRTLDPGPWAINPPWDQGIVVGEADPDGAWLHLETVPIVAGVLRFRGWEVRADAAAPCDPIPAQAEKSEPPATQDATRDTQPTAAPGPERYAAIRAHVAAHPGQPFTQVAAAFGVAEITVRRALKAARA